MGCSTPGSARGANHSGEVAPACHRCGRRRVDMMLNRSPKNGRHEVWGHAAQDWKVAMNQFAILYADRFTKAVA